MERYNITVDIKNKPVLDPDFMPLLRFNQEFEKNATGLCRINRYNQS